MAGARRSSPAHSATRAAATASSGKPRIEHFGPGVLQVTCGHCGATFMTDDNGHAEHHCGGCCALHPDMN